MNKQITWARFPADDELTMYLCMEHYAMGRKHATISGECGHEHWVLPPKEGCACIICHVAKLEAELARLEEEASIKEFQQAIENTVEKEKR